jgi:DTW domain-containing protein YfiP
VSACYCHALPTLDTRTRVVILQHPRERYVAIGTARMASLCLPQASLHVGLRWDRDAALTTLLSDRDRPAILLYPGAAARDVLSSPPPGPVTLVVVDGTWSQAKTVVRDNPVLAALPRYGFATPEPSQYRIRREPNAEYVSTIEALMHVLGVLEGDLPRFRALLDPMRAMVDHQLACQRSAPKRHMRQRPRRPAGSGPKLPSVFSERFEDVVCIAVEANAWPRKDARWVPDELIHLVACRAATGERLDRMVAPVGAVAPSSCFHAQLTPEQLASGTTIADLLAGLRAFLRPADVLCLWGHHGPGLLADAGLAGPWEWMDLRATAQRLTNRRLGTLEQFAAGPGPAPVAPGPGRAGQRLELLLQVVVAWSARHPRASQGAI